MILINESWTRYNKPYSFAPKSYLVQEDMQDKVCKAYSCKLVNGVMEARYNCIGWALGISKWINPILNGTQNGLTKEQAVRDFLDNLNKEYPENHPSNFEGILGKFQITYHISSKPANNTVMLYFENEQFLHASRYITTMQGLELYQWTSKMGNSTLVSHYQYELNDWAYGIGLFYLVVNDSLTSNPLPILTNEITANIQAEDLRAGAKDSQISSIQLEAFKIGATVEQALKFKSWIQLDAFKIGAPVEQALRFDNMNQLPRLEAGLSLEAAKRLEVGRSFEIALDPSDIVKDALDYGVPYKESLLFTSIKQLNAFKLGMSVDNALKFTSWEQVDALVMGATLEEALTLSCDASIDFIA